MVHTSYGVDTLYNLFNAIWRRFKHEIHNKYDTLFIYCNNYNWNTTKHFVIIQFQHIAFMFTESDINRTRKSEVNKQFTDWIKEYLKQNEKSFICVQVTLQLMNKLWSIIDSNLNLDKA